MIEFPFLFSLRLLRVSLWKFFENGGGKCKKENKEGDKGRIWKDCPEGSLLLRSGHFLLRQPGIGEGYQRCSYLWGAN